MPTSQERGEVIPAALHQQDLTEIEFLMHEYSRRIDTGDLEGFAELFRQATWLGHGGYDEVLTWLKSNIILYDGETWTQHLVSNIQINVGDDPDSARARSCIMVMQQVPGESGVRVVRVNVYEDTFTRGDNGWRFTTREVTRRMNGDDSGHLRLPAQGGARAIRRLMD